uniref:Uncharacterized protein n=1 Tax=Photinus pyralis TaxID=7054 RepID=A0A1Y1LXG1_PHOPY
MVAFNINIKFVKETQSRNEYCDEAVPSTSGCRKNFFAEFDESNSHTSTLDDKIKRISYEKDDISGLYNCSLCFLFIFFIAQKLEVYLLKTLQFHKLLIPKKTKEYLFRFQDYLRYPEHQVRLHLLLVRE